MSSDNNWLSCEDVANLEGVSVRAIQTRCAKGSLPCQKKGQAWMINKRKYELQKEEYHDNQFKNGAFTIAVSNAKGGVGKTTISIITADKLSMRGYRVLLVDMDPQGNATRLSGVIMDKEKYKYALYDVLLSKIYSAFDIFPDKRVKTRDAIYSARKFYILPTDINAQKINYWLVNNAHLFETGKEIRDAWNSHFPYLLNSALAEVKNEYDFIIIDTPPEMGWATTNALMCASDVVIPIELGSLEFLGLADVFSFIKKCSEKNTGLDILGIVISRFGPHRSKLDTKLENSIRENKYYGQYLFNTIIYRTLLVREASVRYQSVYEYFRRGISKDSISCLDDFTDELMSKIIDKLNKKVGVSI